jgi:type II secretory pathway component PulK
VSVSHRRAAQRLAERSTLQATADSAIRIVALRLFAPPSSANGQLVRVSATQQLDLPGGLVTVTLQPERRRLDLNTADEQLIFAIFAANGWELHEARAMAARIADWTDVDDEPRKDGAESSDYAAAGRPYGPRNGAFESVEELRQVLGGEDIAPELLDAFTVYTHERVPAPSLASAPVLRALKFADQQHLGAHTWLPEGDVSSLSSDGMQDVGHTFAGEVVRLRACAAHGGVQRCRLAIVRVTGSVRQPLQVYSWRDN